MKNSASLRKPFRNFNIQLRRRMLLSDSYSIGASSWITSAKVGHCWTRCCHTWQKLREWDLLLTWERLPSIPPSPMESPVAVPTAFPITRTSPSARMTWMTKSLMEWYLELLFKKNPLLDVKIIHGMLNLKTFQ